MLNEVIYSITQSWQIILDHIQLRIASYIYPIGTVPL